MKLPVIWGLFDPVVASLVHPGLAFRESVRARLLFLAGSPRIICDNINAND